MFAGHITRYKNMDAIKILHQKDYKTALYLQCEIIIIIILYIIC